MVTAPSPMARQRRQVGPSTILAYGLLIALTGLALLPLVVMLASSFKPGSEIFAVPATLFAEEPTLVNYLKVLTDSDMPRAIANSLLVGLLATLATLVLGLSTGYALSRFRFRGARTLSLALLLGQLLPATVLLLPVYQLILAMNLLNTVPGLAIAMLVFVLPVVTWMLSTTFSAVPVELEEAAMIDGCSRPRAVLLVVLPVAAAGIASVSIFAFLQSWNEFLFASVMTTSAAAKTAPVALTDFANEFTVDWGATMAAASVISIPITIAFLFMQRFFIRGMASGAVKG